MRKLILVTIVSLVLLVSAGAGQAANPGVLPVGSNPYGMTYREWSAAWWQWALSLPNSTSPLFQDGAVDCSNAQSEHASSNQVWFLVGVLNVSGQAERSCSIPSGTALFFPVINVECSTLEPPPFFGSNEAQLRACAHSFGFTNLTATIDGRAVENLAGYTVDSPLYDFTVPADNALGVPGPAQGQSVANGVYLFLSPLSVGEHTLRFGGSYPDFGGFTLDITYHLTVVPRGSFS